MLGFGKKKKDENKDKEAKASKEVLPEDQEIEKGESGADTSIAPKKKRFPKKILIILLVLIAVGVSSYLVYTIYFSSKDPGSAQKKYTQIELKHINLPQEMLKFSFDYFPDLYISMITFNNEMKIFDNEIARIDAIGLKYPDQKKITDKEKKILEKAKNALQKTFLKIEKPVKETYVLFSVNKNQGLVQIEAKSKELTELAKTALKSSHELTQNLIPVEEIPKGFIKGNIYKLKKKFL